MQGDLANTFLYPFEVTLSPADKAGGVCGGELREKNRELGLILMWVRSNPGEFSLYVPLKVKRFILFAGMLHSRQGGTLVLVILL